MLRIYSKGCEYAIKALALMGDPEARYRAADICRKARIPESFSRKVFQMLVRGRFLEAVTGPGGGYRLRSGVCDVSILDIIKAVDGVKSLERCVMGLSVCSDKKPCLMHSSWMNAKPYLIRELEEKKLRDIMASYSGAVRSPRKK